MLILEHRFLLAREVHFYCGQHVITSSMLIRAANNLMRHGRTCCEPDSGSFQIRFSVHGNKDESHNVWHGLNCLLGLAALVGSPNPEFHWVMSVFRMRLSTDPRDKIYGLLGMAPPQLDEIIPLDYTATVEDVFERFTVGYVQHFKDLGILGALGGNRRLANLPSFCPDWTVLPDKTTRNDEATMVQMSNRIVVQKFYLGKPNMTEAIWRQDERGTVAANGFIFDVIRDVSLERFRQSGERCQWVKSIQILAGQSDTMTLLRALCGDMTRLNTGNFALIQDNDAVIEARLLKWWEWTLSGGSSGGPPRDGDINGIEQAVLTACSGRSFVVTEKGYIGYADQHCRPGHVIAILGGGHTPFVLAPASSQYQVIGDAYIHGIMRGDAFKLAGRQTGEFDELILV